MILRHNTEERRYATLMLGLMLVIFEIMRVVPAMIHVARIRRFSLFPAGGITLDTRTLDSAAGTKGFFPVSAPCSPEMSNDELDWRPQCFTAAWNTQRVA